jgi:hypothetical protein
MEELEPFRISVQLVNYLEQQGMQLELRCRAGDFRRWRDAEQQESEESELVQRQSSGT